jgi:hypothetical protein
LIIVVNFFNTTTTTLAAAAAGTSAVDSSGLVIHNQSDRIESFGYRKDSDGQRQVLLQGLRDGNANQRSFKNSEAAA